MTNRPRNPRQSKPVYAIVAEGGTENWYCQMLREHEKNNIKVTIEPAIRQGQSLDDQFKRIENLVTLDYTKIFWIVDMDTVGENPTHVFWKYKAKCEKLMKNIIIIMNHPCFEFWLLTHFENCNAPFRKCTEASKRLGPYLPGYEKTEKFYKKPDSDIYKKLKENLEKARDRSRGKEFNSDSPFQGFSQMHKLFDELLPIPEKK